MTRIRKDKAHVWRVFRRHLMQIRTVTARAPVRVDFLGGWTDLPLFTELCPGYVLNTSITLYTYATIRGLPTNLDRASIYGVRVLSKEELEQKASSGIEMYSEDFDTNEYVSSVAEMEYDGSFNLAKAACKRLGVDDAPGIQIVTRTEAPPGSGLGTSASLAVALTGALSRYFSGLAYQYKGNPPYGTAAIADLAYRIEAEELGFLTGTQDHYAAAWGNLSLWHCTNANVIYNPIRLSLCTGLELESRCVLVYTGTPRLSSDIHKHVRSAYTSGQNHETIKELATLAKIGVNYLYNSELQLFGQLLTRNWNLQKELHESVTNSKIDSYFDIAMANGAIGGKACGAGGGGCLLFMAAAGRGHVLRKALRDAGLAILPFQIDEHGLDTWENKE